MKRGRWLLYILPLAVISFGWIGFASYKGWNINPEAEASFAFGADEVRTFNERFDVETNISQATSFTKDGIIGSEDVTVDGATHKITTISPENPLSITIRFTYKSEENKTIESYMPDGAKGFNLMSVLEDENASLDLFDLASATSATLSYDQGEKGITSSYAYTASGTLSSESSLYSSYLFALDLEESGYLSASILSFAVKYTIEFNDDIDFETEVYNKLDNAKLQYSLLVGAIGWIY